MKPITAKGGEGLPKLRSKGKLIMVRTGFKLSESDVKAMDNLCKNLGKTRAEWMKWQIERSLGNE